MASDMLINALRITNGYLNQNYSKSELKIIRDEISAIIDEPLTIYDSSNRPYSYEEMQELLSTLNEKETIRKNKGVYYTPLDVVKFILINSVKMVCNRLKPNNLHVLDLMVFLIVLFAMRKQYMIQHAVLAFSC